jgi:hypothetical protein
MILYLTVFQSHNFGTLIVILLADSRTTKTQNPEMGKKGGKMINDLLDLSLIRFDDFGNEILEDAGTCGNCGVFICGGAGKDVDDSDTVEVAV